MDLITRLRSANEKLAPRHYLFSPDWIVLGVNNVCNLHCRMCDVGLGNTDTNFARNLTGSKPLNMPLELVERIVAQTGRDFPSAKIGFAFTEPLIYPHLIDAIRCTSQHGLASAVTTNGLHLARHAREIAESGLDDLYVSLDGLGETHNLIRGHRRSFEAAVEGIEAVLDTPGPPAVSVFCVITEWNYTRLAAFAEYFSRLPLSHLGFMHTNFTTPAVAAYHNARLGDRYPATTSNLGEMSLEKIDIDALYEEIRRIRSCGWPFPVTFSPEIDSRRALSTFYRQPETLIGRRCRDVFRSIMVKSDGRVIPAHGRCYDLTLGNLYSERLKEIWQSSTLAALRGDLHRAGGLFPACSRCCSAFD